MNKVKIQSYIEKLPISSYNRIRLYGGITHLYWKMKCSPEECKRRISSKVFTPSGFYYGQEQWLKRYCGFNDSIYAHIEHGVYFGDNATKVGWSPEWDLGNVVTFGDSRYELLRKLYPDFNIVRVGPRVHYALTDYNYYNELKSQLNHDGKTMALYPLHSIHDDKHVYNTNAFLEGAFELGRQYGVKNYLLSLHPTDLEHGADLLYKDENVILVTGGPANEGFLPRLRAIMELSDLTYSNALGTHVGYSVYLGTPHVLDLRSNPPAERGEFSTAVRKRFYEEQSQFADVFSGNDALTITPEQRDLCDFYWGYSHIKTPEELYKELEYCKEYFFKNFKRNR